MTGVQTCALPIYTGATKTIIIRPDLIPKRAVTKPTKWQLRTATGDPARTHGEFQAEVTLDTTSFKHPISPAAERQKVVVLETNPILAYNQMRMLPLI